MLRRICGPNRKEVTGKWRQLCNEELTDLYSMPNIFFGDQIKKNKMGVACSTYGGEDVHTRLWWETLSERGHVEDPGIDRRIILRWILRALTGLI